MPTYEQPLTIYSAPSVISHSPSDWRDYTLFMFWHVSGHTWRLGITSTSWLSLLWVRGIGQKHPKPLSHLTGPWREKRPVKASHAITTVLLGIKAFVTSWTPTLLIPHLPVNSPGLGRGNVSKVMSRCKCGTPPSNTFKSQKKNLITWK